MLLGLLRSELSVSVPRPPTHARCVHMSALSPAERVGVRVNALSPGLLLPRTLGEVGRLTCHLGSLVVCTHCTCILTVVNNLDLFGFCAGVLGTVTEGTCLYLLVTSPGL